MEFNHNQAKGPPKDRQSHQEPIVYVFKAHGFSEPMADKPSDYGKEMKFPPIIFNEIGPDVVDIFIPLRVSRALVFL